jgi:hypothetical protein
VSRILAFRVRRDRWRELAATASAKVLAFAGGRIIMAEQDGYPRDLPACVVEYIRLVVKRVRYTRAARREVRQELTDHFTDALADCPTPEQRQTRAEQLIAEFGDASILGALIRRGKKRNRPTWEKALIRTFQGFLLLLVLLGLYTAWFAFGRPTISTDFLAMMNQRVQPKARQDENAWPLYRKAITRYVEAPTTPQRGTTTGEPGAAPPYFEPPDELMPLPAASLEAIRAWAEQNGPAWETFVAATGKPYCWREYGFDPDAAPAGQKPPAPSVQPEGKVWEKSMIGILLPHLGWLRKISCVGIWKAHLAAGQGHLDQACEMALAVARAGGHWQDPNKTLIEQLVGISMGSRACQVIRGLVATRACPASLLTSCQEQLGEIFSEGYPAFSVLSERLAQFDYIQRAFTQGGPGGGHIIPSQMMALVHYTGYSGTSWPRSGLSVTEGQYWVGVSLLHAGRDETTAIINTLLDRAEAWCKLTPYEQHGRPDDDNPDRYIMTLSSTRFGFAYMLMPSFARAGELACRNKAEYEATLTILALQRYKIDSGEYPTALKDLLSGGYLKQLPMDPYSPGPLVYRKTGDAFTLYSVAADFADDGGKAIPDDGWEPVSRNGRIVGSDHVFWPVQRRTPPEDAPATRPNG